MRFCQIEIPWVPDLVRDDAKLCVDLTFSCFLLVCLGMAPGELFIYRE